MLLLHYIQHCYITLHYIQHCYITLHVVTCYYFTSNIVTLHYMLLHVITLHPTLLHYIQHLFLDFTASPHLEKDFYQNFRWTKFAKRNERNLFIFVQNFREFWCIFDLIFANLRNLVLQKNKIFQERSKISNEFCEFRKSFERISKVSNEFRKKSEWISRISQFSRKFRTNFANFVKSSKEFRKNERKFSFSLAERKCVNPSLELWIVFHQVLNFQKFQKTQGSCYFLQNCLYEIIHR